MTTLEQALTDAREVLVGSCALATIRDALEPVDRTALDAALIDTQSPSAALAAALTASGHRVAPAAVRDHRTGDCPCVIPQEA